MEPWFHPRPRGWGWDSAEGQRGRATGGGDALTQSRAFKEDSGPQAPTSAGPLASADSTFPPDHPARSSSLPAAWKEARPQPAKWPHVERLILFSSLPRQVLAQDGEPGSQGARGMGHLSLILSSSKHCPKMGVPGF